MDCGEEVSGGFVVAGGDSAILLELAEEVLDEISRLVDLFVVVALDFAIALRRDHPFVGIEGLVCQ